MWKNISDDELRALVWRAILLFCAAFWIGIVVLVTGLALGKI
ncbi:hypothetical protein [Megasphaera elsdenii]|nr:hypothetical protein [Megasphaera elsdenii]